MNHSKKQKGTLGRAGFTLVELLVVIAIIAILSVTAYVALGGQTVKARDSKRMEDLSVMQSALEVYFIENSKYPAAPLVQGNDVAAGEVPKKYLSIIPTDPGPAGRAYQYAVSGSTYQIAATLEKDGDVANYEVYTVGAGEGLLMTAGGLGHYNNTGVLTACTDGRLIDDGVIGTADADGNCIPYNPLN